MTKLYIPRNTYPFGSVLGGRNGNSSIYKYGYQGSEKDDEVKGAGNSYTTEYRFLDPRLGRWLSIDPLAGRFPWQSPYLSMDNNPIGLNDIKGGSTGGDDKKYDLTGYDVTGPNGKKFSVPLMTDEGGMALHYQYKDNKLISFDISWPSSTGKLTFTWNNSLQNYYSSVEGLTFDDFVYEFQVDANESHFSYSIGKAAKGYIGFASLLVSMDFKEIWSQLNNPENNQAIENYSFYDIGLVVFSSGFSKYKTSYLKTINKNIEAKISANKRALAADLAYYNKLADDIYDCSDYARMFSKRYGGTILELKPKSGKWLKGIEYGKVVSFQYHQVLEYHGYIYDPMLGGQPIKKSTFIKKYNSLNPNGITIE